MLKVIYTVLSVTNIVLRVTYIVVRVTYVVFRVPLVLDDGKDTVVYEEGKGECTGQCGECPLEL